MIHHWDFFGPDAQQTAEHFRKHFHQFSEQMVISAENQGFFSADESHTCFWAEVCDDGHSRLIEEKLRPRRSLTVSGHSELLQALADSRSEKK